MSSLSDSIVSSTAASLDGASPRPELGSSGFPSLRNSRTPPEGTEEGVGPRANPSLSLPRGLPGGGPDGGCGHQAIAWGGEVVKRLTQAQREANHHHTNFVEAMGNHAELTAQLEELKDIRAQEKKASEAVQEALRAQLVAEKRARASEEESLRTELEVALEGKTIVEAELKETQTRTAKEIEHLRAEVANARTIGKEEFLKSPEFDRLLVKKSVAYFKSGFDGAVAQFRTNGFPEEEFPAPFLDMKKALREMPDGPVEEEKEEEEEVGETSGNESTAQDEDVPPSSPQ
ncbi:hypothetical protein F511_41478 [Dorcoceras hygrometricum]|uniref:Uncharacterized protein n=1 Tax=Dorcoceras hygrometricum TaxID=472368 RepID=A0A2Z7DDJ8_9LAMI|nr:hypothetical protein F511_41478 [Dorcoceras hygrometricum]